MKDEYGRIDNKAQVIRRLNKVRMAYLFNDMKEHPEKYPNSRSEWLDWLNKDSGETLDTL